MATKAEIRQRVAENLALTVIGSDAQSQDATRIDATYDEIYQRLKEEGIAVWASTAEVPDKIVPYYVLMMEYKLARSYAVSDARFQRILAEAGQDGDIAMRKIARLVTPDYETTSLNEDF